MTSHSFFMARALELAAKGLYSTSPNPRVGCVIIDKHRKIIGEGWHEKAGEPHAEIHALKMAGVAAHGATAYVTLEPCSHFGRTPPCAQALIQAGISHVVAAMQDPNPRVAGEGFACLRKAGIKVTTDVMSQQATVLNEGFISRMTRGKPWVRIKIASTLDGKIALNNGQSQWITGQAARIDAHHWRARSCAILTGIGTVLADNPRLDVRAVPTQRQPLKVIVDTQLRTPLEASVLKNGHVLIATCSADINRINALTDQGAEIIQLPNASGHIDLGALMKALGQRGINDILTEAGSGLNGALIESGNADALLLYQSPSLLGDKAQSMLNLQEIVSLDARQSLCIDDVTKIGNDLRILARF